MGKAWRDKPFVGSSFSRYVDEYFLNNKGSLEKLPIQKDIHEYIQSQRQTLFETLLDSYHAPINVSESEPFVNETVRHLTNLDIFLEADSLIDEYRRENNLSSEVSREEIYGLITDKVRKIREDFVNKKNESEVKPNEEVSTPQESK